VLTPGHSVLWYQTVLSFLHHHVRDGEESVASTLG